MPRSWWSSRPTRSWKRGKKAAAQRDYREVVLAAVKEVAGPTFFALLVIAVSFLPVLTLEAQEGRMFKPLAYTKTLAMVVAAVLAITLDPALRLLLTNVKPLHLPPGAGSAALTNAVLIGKIRSEDRHPLSRVLMRIYEPVVRWTLRWKWVVVAAAVALVMVTIPCFPAWAPSSCRRWMKARILYMPSTMPGISIARGAAASASHRPHHPAISRSRSGAGQSGPRRDLHRSAPRSPCWKRSSS